MENGEDRNDENFVALRSERRKHLRKQLIVLQVKGTDKKGVFFGYAKTIGSGGMFIASVNPRQVGEEFEITFRPDGDDKDIRCRCVVVWRREYEPHKQEPGIGIRFLSLNDEDKMRIEELIKRI
ncbi:MAG: PilZ domain-containing protein [Deltaproteobacteria bacterium]